MTPERLRKIESLFHQARERDPTARAAFLREACETDSDLRREVETLLSGVSDESPLDRGAASVAVRALEQRRDLAPGDQLGSYLIESSLGSGGMGTVYRARDARLDRTVAIKVLRLARGAEMSARFAREARVIAQLQHPNICTLHDVGEESGLEYLVMEYLEGETLSERLRRGPLPVDTALRYAVEIAAALGHAHRRAIVHRDLKPSNIMVLKSGVKLLDFGVASWLSVEPSALTKDTVSLSLTNPGAMVGTPPYMAPEQFRGERVDARTDIFAFGLLLYEMLRGKRAFPQTDLAPLREAILNMPLAPISASRPEAPPALDRVIALCTEKEPDERWQDAGDLGRELAWIAASPRPTKARRAPAFQWIAATVVLLACVFAAAWAGYRMHTAPDPREVRVYLPPPEANSYAPRAGLALSPDGEQIAFIARNSDGKDLLWIRTIQQYPGSPLQDTEGARLPFWSPDGRTVAFFAGARLKKVAASGGPVETICEAAYGAGGAWGSDGTILFAPDPMSPLNRVVAAGGQPKPVSVIDAAHGDYGHSWPAFLPDGRHFLFVATSLYSTAVHIGSLDSADDKRLTLRTSRALFRSGRLYYAAGTLRWRPFDLSRLEFTGEEQAVSGLESTSAFDIAVNGTIAFRSGGSAPERTIAWVDRTGAEVASAFSPGRYAGVALAPDGHTVALAISAANGSTSIWLDDLKRPNRRVFAQNASFPVWSPDGKRIAYLSGLSDIRVKSMDGSRDSDVVAHGDVVAPYNWSRDGQYISYTEHLRQENRYVTFLLPWQDNAKPIRFASAVGSWSQVVVSPDGHWISYWSNERGSPQVFVARLPDGSDKKQVSSHGGQHPQWREDGRELYFIDMTQHLSAAAVTPRSGTLEIGEPKSLFEVNPGPRGMGFVPTDGSRFLIVKPFDGSQSEPIVVDLRVSPTATKK
jgi:Tol biopolymer transport system component